jgi:hypothetical protein
MIASCSSAFANEQVVVACKFEKLPLMLLTFNGGMGSEENTLQIGERTPVLLSVGSSLMVATVDAQEFVFSLRMPASVTVSGPGSSDNRTFDGECISSLRR